MECGGFAEAKLQLAGDGERLLIIFNRFLKAIQPIISNAQIIKRVELAITVFHLTADLKRLIVSLNRLSILAAIGISITDRVEREALPVTIIQLLPEHQRLAELLTQLRICISPLHH